MWVPIELLATYRQPISTQSVSLKRYCQSILTQMRGFLICLPIELCTTLINVMYLGQNIFGYVNINYLCHMYSQLYTTITTTIKPTVVLTRNFSKYALSLYRKRTPGPCIYFEILDINTPCRPLIENVSRRSIVTFFNLLRHIFWHEVLCIIIG